MLLLVPVYRRHRQQPRRRQVATRDTGRDVGYDDNNKHDDVEHDDTDVEQQRASALHVKHNRKMSGILMFLFVD